MSVWKAFENNELSHSDAHYLMAIDELIQNDGKCRAASIARTLDISRNAVSLKLQAMIRQQLVNVDDDHLIHLTAGGLTAVENVISIRRSFQFFLTDVLGIDKLNAQEDSCKVEHLLSEDTGVKLLKLAKFIQSNDQHALSFIDSLNKFEVQCDHNEEACPICHHRCFAE